jgi:hypothetical protein
VILMELATNWLAALMLAVSILFYVLVYTIWLKRRTPQNIVIGGAAGAFPPVIGWAAATGHVGLLPSCCSLIIFLWTPPHFWALSLFVRSDYAAAGVPMLPVVAGRQATRRQILLYSLPMAAAAVAPWPLGLAGPFYGIVAAAFSLVFVGIAAEVLAQPADRAGRHEGREEVVRFLDPLSVRSVRRAGGRPLVAGVTDRRAALGRGDPRDRRAAKPPSDEEIRRRQRARAIVMAVLLARLRALVYAITIAKMSINR